MEINEITIPVPWGHIAAKTWGSPNNPPVLTVHGILDNAATFDFLIPKLPPTYHYVCIDLPGHGKSTHFPGDLLINALDYVVVYKIIARHFCWKKFSIIGHSLGAQVAEKYLELFPYEIERAILLDAVYFIPFRAKIYASQLRKGIDSLLRGIETEKPEEAPTYSREELLEKVMNSRGELLSREAAIALTARGAVKVGDRYRFSHDQKLRHYVPPPGDFKYAADAIKGIKAKCPILIVVCTQSLQAQYVKPLVELWGKEPNCTVEQVEGGHDTHLTNPDSMAPIIFEFLNVRSSKL